MLRRTGKHGRRCKQVQAREQVHEARAAGTACGAIVRTGQPCCGEGRAQTLVVERLGSRFLGRMGEDMWGRTQRVEPRVGGLRWHAMRVGRLLYCGALKARRAQHFPENGLLHSKGFVGLLQAVTCTGTVPDPNPPREPALRSPCSP